MRSGAHAGRTTKNYVAAGGLYPNRPAAFTLDSEIDFSQTIPTGNDQIDNDIVGAPGWGFIRFGTNWTKVGDTWVGHWAAGVYPDSHGIGDLYAPLSFGSSGTMYISIRMRINGNANDFHGTSNKFVNIETDHGQILKQLKETTHYRHPEELAVGGSNWYGDDDPTPGENHLGPQLDNRAVPVNQDFHIEVVIDIPNGLFKVWQDGVLTSSYSSVPFVATELNQFGLYAFRGGGGETLAHDIDWIYQHIKLAWKP